MGNTSTLASTASTFSELYIHTLPITPSPNNAQSWENRCSEPGWVVRSMTFVKAGIAARRMAGVWGEWRKVRARCKDYNVRRVRQKRFRIAVKQMRDHTARMSSDTPVRLRSGSGALSSTALTTRMPRSLYFASKSSNRVITGGTTRYQRRSYASVCQNEALAQAEGQDVTHIRRSAARTKGGRYRSQGTPSIPVPRMHPERLRTLQPCEVACGPTRGSAWDGGLLGISA